MFRAGPILAVALVGAMLVPRARAQDHIDELLDRVAKMADETKQDAERARKKRRDEIRKNGTRVAFAVSPDGRMVAAGAPNGDVEVWKPGEREPLVVLRGHTDILNSIAFAPTSTILRAVAEDGVARQWDVATGELIATLGEPDEKGEDGTLLGFAHVCVSPDGVFVAYPTQWGSLDVWDGAAGDWMEDTPYRPALGRVTFLGDSRHVLLRTAMSFELQDLRAPPQRDPEDDELYAADPVWTLSVRKASFGSGGADFGDAFYVQAEYLETANLLVTVAHGRPGKASRPKAVLRAFDARTAKSKFERELPSDKFRPVEARKAEHIVLLGERTLQFLSAENGKLLKSFPLPPGNARPRVMAPDASAWYDADSKGQLIETILIPRASPDADEPAGDPPTKTD